MSTCYDLNLDGLVIIGDAAQLVENFTEHSCKTKVVGVPVSLHANLKNLFVEANLGFDTVCKTLILRRVLSKGECTKIKINPRIYSKRRVDPDGWRRRPEIGWLRGRAATLGAFVDRGRGRVHADGQSLRGW